MLTQVRDPINFLQGVPNLPLLAWRVNLKFQNQFSRSGKHSSATFRFLLANSTNKFAMGQISVFQKAFWQLLFFVSMRFDLLYFIFEPNLIGESSTKCRFHFFLQTSGKNTFEYQHFRCVSFPHVSQKSFKIINLKICWRKVNAHLDWI